MMDYIYKETTQNKFPFMIKTEYPTEKKICIQVFVNKIYQSNFREKSFVQDLYTNKHLNKVKQKTSPDAQYFENLKENDKNFVRWTLDKEIIPGECLKFDAEIIEYGMKYIKVDLKSFYEGLYSTDFDQLGNDTKKSQNIDYNIQLL